MSQFDWIPPKPLTLEEARQRKFAVPLIKTMLNTSKYSYFIRAVKAPLMKAVIVISKRYPEPTHENVLKPNSHRLLNIRDEFLRCEHNPHTEEFFRAAFRIIIVTYEHDGYYARRIDKVLSWIAQSGWEFGEKMDSCWFTK